MEGEEQDRQRTGIWKGSEIIIPTKPADKNIKEIEEGIPAEVTEIWYGADNIVKRQLEIITKASTTVDYCHSSESPSIIVTFNPFIQIIIELNKKGVRQRYITEVNEGNIKYCKKLAEYVELRHLDSVQGTLGIIDRKIYGAIANTRENHLPTEFIYSNVKSFVDQQQFFFETLWNKAIPAEQRIREIEEGIPVETTEIIHGIETILNKAIEGLSLTKERFDNCIDHTCPSSYVLTRQIWGKCIDLSNKGIRLRFITEITSDNIRYCKEIMKIADLRHLDGIMGNFGISDGRDYRATASMQRGQPPTQAIRSTIKTFVDQQQFFFETLWNKAIPAKQRIREIEEGITPETVQTLNNPVEIQKLANKLVSRAKKELLIVFPTAAEFYRQQNSSNGFLKKITSIQKKSLTSKKTKGSSTLDLRITVPGRNTNNNNPDRLQHLLRKGAQEKYSSVRIRSEIRYIDTALSTNVAVIIVDRKHSLVIEVREDQRREDDSDDDYTSTNHNIVMKGKRRGANTTRNVPALAIYTNSRALVMSTVTMFELLWTHIELYEELKLRDIERREFIDIAAHELRGPIQPIVGLAKEIRSRYDLDKDDKILGAILRSAANLQTLANNILDVARIESKSLNLKISKFDLITLVRASVDDFRHELLRKNALKIRFKSNNKRLFINADRGRIYQVIYNLIANAIKFTDRGSISISAIKKDGKVIFSVRDTGQGIDEKVIPKLFSKFNTSPTTSGTGLGLFISRRIINAHGGDISGVNNRENGNGEGGATFTFTFPVNGTKTTKTHNVRTRE